MSAKIKLDRCERSNIMYAHRLFDNVFLAELEGLGIRKLDGELIKNNKWNNLISGEYVFLFGFI